MSNTESSQIRNTSESSEPLIELVVRIRHGEFTRAELKLRENEGIAPLLTIGELIESSFDLGNVHWEGDVLKLGGKPVQP